MDLWLEAEVRVRRDELYAVARLARLIRLAESGRSGHFSRIANSFPPVLAVSRCVGEASYRLPLIHERDHSPDSSSSGLS